MALQDETNEDDVGEDHQGQEGSKMSSGDITMKEEYPDWKLGWARKRNISKKGQRRKVNKL